MHRYIRAADTLEFTFQFFLARVYNHRSAFVEQQFFNLDKTKHDTLVHITGVDLIDLALIMENYLVNGLVSHDYKPGYQSVSKGERIIAKLCYELNVYRNGPSGPSGKPVCIQAMSNISQTIKKAKV